MFPNAVHTGAQEQETGFFGGHALLPITIGSLSSDAEIPSILRSGNRLIIISSALTALSIAMCFAAAGYWLEGAVAGLGGGLSSAFLVRSSIGRIDTDQLNLGFFYLLFALVILVGRSNTTRATLIWSALAGFTSNLFLWWYDQSVMVQIVAIALLWALISSQKNLAVSIVCLVIFLVTSGQTFLNPFDSIYFKESLSQGSFIYPNTLDTISEIRRISLSQTLVQATGSVAMGFVCLSGLALFAIRHPVLTITLAPLIAFGLLNFVIGNRAIFYSAPILWFGAAFLMTTTARFIINSISQTTRTTPQQQHASIIAASLAMIIAWVSSPTHYLPKPSFPKPVLEGLASLEESTEPDNSVVVTWWDYGYASMLFNQLPTLHDGGTQATPTTHFVAQAMLDADQSMTLGNLKFLSTAGHKGLRDETSLEELGKKFAAASTTTSPDLYLVVTSQMAGWMGAISQIGNWDIERGEPVDLRGNPNGPLVNYERLNCRLGGYPQKLLCTGAAFDLERGLVNGAPVLAGWAHSQDGTTVRGKSFDHDGDVAVQIIQTGHMINVFLMHRQLFESSFNELFYLGQIDHPSISLHYDNYPHIRIYKINGEFEG